MKRRNPLIAFLFVACSLCFANAQQTDGDTREKTRTLAQSIDHTTIFQGKVTEVAYLDSVVSNVVSNITDEWYKGSLKSNIRDLDNTLVSESFITFNDDQSLFNGNRSNYTYYSDDLLETEEQQDAIGLDNWINNTKEYMTYDASGNMDSLLTKAWQISASTWYNYELVVNKYNQDNQVTVSDNFRWNLPTLSWKPVSQSLTEYADKEETLIIAGENAEGVWTNRNKTETFFDDEDRFIKVVQYKWTSEDDTLEPNAGQWVLNSETEVFYEDDGKLSEYAVYVYAGPLVIYGSKIEYLYQNDLHSESVYYSYDLGSQNWLKSYHKLINRDVNGNVLFVQDQTWDENAGMYNNTHQNWEYYYTYIEDVVDPTDTTDVVDPVDPTDTTDVVDPIDTTDIVDPVDTTDTSIEMVNLTSISISPNPSYGVFSVKNNMIDGENLDFTMYNTAGELMIQTKFQKTLEVNAAHLPKGIYFIQIGNGDSSTRKKVVIQ